MHTYFIIYRFISAGCLLIYLVNLFLFKFNKEHTMHVCLTYVHIHRRHKYIYTCANHTSVYPNWLARFGFRYFFFVPLCLRDECMLVMIPTVHSQMGIHYFFFCNDDHMTSADHGVDESRPLRLWNWTESKPNPKRTMKRATTRSNKYHKTEDGTRENCLKIERRSDFHEVSSGMSKNAVKFMNFANARKSMQTRWDS